MKLYRTVCLFLSIGFLAPIGSGELIIGSDTSFWNPITYGGNTPADITSDQSPPGTTELDVVGDAAHASFYTQFDDAGTSNLTDGTLAFRVRLARPKNDSKMVFEQTLLVGLDANLDGALDLFVGVDNGDTPNQLAIWSLGTDANTGPDTITIADPPVLTFNETIGINYAFSLVTTEMDPSATDFDIDGGGDIDVFLSFSFNFNDIVSLLNEDGISIDQNSGINYVMATSTGNNLVDLNGINGGTDSTLTFNQLGAVSDTFSPTGDVVPEPAVITLLGAGGLALLIGRRFLRPKNSV